MDVSSSSGMARADIQQIMDRIKQFSEKTKSSASLAEPTESGSFGQILSQAESFIDKSNSLQNTAEATNQAWITGANNVSVSQVVVAAEKSRLAMEGLVTVRNKILESYREIMNMQI